jgi:hypothetical protein
MLMWSKNLQIYHNLKDIFISSFMRIYIYSIPFIIDGNEKIIIKSGLDSTFMRKLQ